MGSSQTYLKTIETLRELKIDNPVRSTLQLINDAAKNPTLSETEKQSLLEEKTRAIHRIKCLYDLKTKDKK